jgi:hypothetical protein
MRLAFLPFRSLRAVAGDHRRQDDHHDSNALAARNATTLTRVRTGEAVPRATPVLGVRMSSGIQQGPNGARLKRGRGDMEGGVSHI